MKIAKKLLAAVSALAMVATMLSSVAVVNAASDPSVELKIAETEEGSGLYNISVALDVTQCEGGSYVYGLQFKIPLSEYIDSSTLLDTAMNEDTFEDEYVNLGYGPGKFASMATINIGSKGDIIYVFADTTGVGQNLPQVRDIITFKNLKLKDGITTGDIELGFSEFMLQVGAKDSTGEMYTLDVEQLNKITFPGNKEPEPEPEPGLDVEQVGTVFEPTDAEAEVMPNQRAVASIATIEDGQASGSIKWSIDVTGANAGSYDKTFELPTFEAGEVKIGLIVEYDTSEADSVEITGATMVN